MIPETLSSWKRRWEKKWRDYPRENHLNVEARKTLEDVLENKFYTLMKFIENDFISIIGRMYAPAEANRIADSIMVIGEFSVSGVVFPVWMVSFPVGDTFVFSYDDEHAWVISVVSRQGVEGDFEDLICHPHLPVHPKYYQGVPREWIFGPIEESRHEFTISISRGYKKIFTFCWIYASSIKRRTLKIMDVAA